MSFAITENKDNQWGFNIGKVISRRTRWIEIHWYNTYYKGRTPVYCQFRPVYEDSLDTKEIFTNQPRRGYTPFIAEVWNRKILVDKVELTKDGRIPLPVLRKIHAELKTRGINMEIEEKYQDNFTIHQVMGDKIMKEHHPQLTPQLVGEFGSSLYKIATRERPRKHRGRNVYSAKEVKSMLGMLSTVSKCMSQQLQVREQEVTVILTNFSSASSVTSTSDVDNISNDE